MTRETGSEKFTRLRLIIFANRLTDFKTGPWFCKAFVSAVLTININDIIRNISEARAKHELKDFPRLSLKVIDKK